MSLAWHLYFNKRDTIEFFDVLVKIVDENKLEPLEYIVNDVYISRVKMKPRETTAQKPNMKLSPFLVAKGCHDKQLLLC
jgi:uncharacterized protein YihD (DUF1040 family)